MKYEKNIGRHVALSIIVVGPETQPEQERKAKTYSHLLNIKWESKIYVHVPDSHTVGSWWNEDWMVKLADGSVGKALAVQERAAEFRS